MTFTDKYIGEHYANYSLPKWVQDTEPQQSTPALEQAGKGQAQGATRTPVCFRLCRTRLLDADAKYGSVKDLLDALQYAGAIHGDREDQIMLEVRQEKVAHRHEEKTVIEIELPPPYVVDTNK